MEYEAWSIDGEINRMMLFVALAFILAYALIFNVSKKIFSLFMDHVYYEIYGLIQNINLG